MQEKRNRASLRRFLRMLCIDLIVLIVLRLLLGLAGCFAEEDAGDTLQAHPVVAMSEAERVDLLVLMYHSVRMGPESDYSVTPETLRADLTYLRDHGYCAVTPEDLVRYVNDAIPLPEHPVLITFDDGFYNNLAYALPLLKEYACTAVVNVVGQFTQELAVADSHVPAYSYLTPDDLAVLIASGHITLGNHTTNFHHRGTRNGCQILCGEDENRYHALLYGDLSQLQNVLTQTLGITPIVFAYPYGFDCAESIPVLHELGFLVTLTCYEHSNTIVQGQPDSLYGLGRFNRAGNCPTETFFARILA